MRLPLRGARVVLLMEPVLPSSVAGNWLVHRGLPVAKVVKLENVLGIPERVVVDILRQRRIPVGNHIHPSAEGHIHCHAGRELMSSIETVRPRELPWVALVWSRVDEVSVHGGRLVARH